MINKSLLAKIGAKAYIISVLSNLLYDDRTEGFANPEEILIRNLKDLQILAEEVEGGGNEKI